MTNLKIGKLTFATAVCSIFWSLQTGISAEQNEPQQQERILDGFEASDWTTSNAENTIIKTSLVPGKDGKALKIEYDLKQTKQWVSINKEMALPSFPKGKAIQFYLQVQGNKNNNLEVKFVDEDGTNFGYKFTLKPAEDWQLIHIDWTDFSYWWGGNPELNNVKQIHFAISADQGMNGTVILDDLRIVPSKKVIPAIQSGLIDSGNSLDGWYSEGGEGSKYKLFLVPGKEKQAVELEYDLGQEGKWVQFYKLVPLELTSKSAFKFLLKWSGKQNNLEFKISDQDRSNFGKKFENLTRKDKWQEIVIPVSELSYMWGGDKNLDMKNILGIWLAVSEKKGGKGSIAIDQLQLVP